MNQGTKKSSKISIITITLLFTNLCSILSKFSELETQVTVIQLTLVILTETWLNKNISNQAVNIANYELFRRDPKDRREVMSQFIYCLRLQILESMKSSPGSLV